MAKSKKATAFVVVRIHWQYDGGQNRTNVRVEGDPSHPVWVGRDRTAAEARAKKLDAAYRKRAHPFHFGMTYDQLFSDISTKTHDEFVEWLAANGFPTPKTDGTSGYTAMTEWWEAASAGLTPKRRQLLWDQFDKIQLYAVKEVEFAG